MCEVFCGSFCTCSNVRNFKNSVHCCSSVPMFKELLVVHLLRGNMSLRSSISERRWVLHYKVMYQYIVRAWVSFSKHSFLWPLDPWSVFCLYMHIVSCLLQFICVKDVVSAPVPSQAPFLLIYTSQTLRPHRSICKTQLTVLVLSGSIYVCIM